MADPDPASGKVLSFPALKQNFESPVENWTHRILETKDNLVTALELLRISYNAIQAGKPIREAGKILEQVEAILRHAEKPKETAAPPGTDVLGSNLQPAKPKPLLLFPPIWRN